MIIMREKRDRMEVLNQIDALLENHCKPCTDRIGSYIAHQCNKECSVGFKLQELGKRLSQNTETIRLKREEKRLSAQADRFTPDKMEFLKLVAKGKRISAIERLWGMSPNALYYHIGKWDLKGIKPEQAKLLLDEMAIDGETKDGAVKEVTVKTEEKLLREKALPQRVSEDIKAAEMQAEIERLQNELTAAINEQFKYQQQLKTAEAESEKQRKARIEAEEIAEQAKTRVAELEKLREENEQLSSDLSAALESIDKSMTLHDPVNHPSHYTAGNVECIDAIESATVGLSGGQAYATGAAIKYLWRWSRKAGLEDLQKARWYIDRLIALVEQDTTQETPSA